MSAGIPGNKNAALRAGVEQPLAAGIFAHGPNVGAFRNPGGDGGPGFSEVGGFENVRLEIVEPVPVHRGIGAVGIERRRLNQVDGAPFRHFRADVSPGFPVIGAQLNEAIVRAGPERALFHG